MNIEGVLSKTDLFDLVEKAGGSIGTDGRCACPIHGGQDSNAFHIYTDLGKQKWKCFSGSCGGGDALDFVQAWRSWDLKQAYEFLGGEQQYDPAEMKRLADDRHARAEVELKDKLQRMEAARKELQVAQRHLFYHQNMEQWAKDLWTERGLDEGLQEFFTLGACNDFADLHTPTLTIPIFGEGKELLNIKHRLLNPKNPKDKYRPETHGLGAFPPLLAVPEMGYEGELIVVVEGEIKAMVTWTRLPAFDFQVIGVGGKNSFKPLTEKLFGKKVVVIPDPDGHKEAVELAHAVSGRVLYLPEKVDDYLLQTGATVENFYHAIRQARRV
jgi:hypothetical protein